MLLINVVGIKIVNNINIILIIGFVIFFIVLVMVFLGEYCFVFSKCEVFFIIIIVLFIIIVMVSINLNRVKVLIENLSVVMIVSVLISDIGMVIYGMMIVC